MMEKQKIFWVVLSVTVFVVVVLVVGVFLLKQKSAPLSPTETVSPLSDTGTRIYEYSRETPQVSTPQPKPDGPEVMKFVIGEEKGDGGEPGKALDKTPKETAGRPADEIPAAVKKAPSAGVHARREEGPTVSKKSASVKPAPARTARVVEYWIQTGSYKSQSRAEELAGLLESKGLSGRVFSLTSKNDTYFRVRIGPYANREEAGKFLGIVKRIQGLESSYISSVSAARYVN